VAKVVYMSQANLFLVFIRKEKNQHEELKSEVKKKEKDFFGRNIHRINN